MTPAAIERETIYRAANVHPFLVAETQFLYLVESGAIVDLSDTAASAFALIRDRSASRQDVVLALVSRGYEPDEVREALDELDQFGAIFDRTSRPDPMQEPPVDFPIQTMALNLTSQCHSTCGYCPEFGEDDAVSPEDSPRFMKWETAQSATDRLVTDSKGRQRIHLAFSGVETLMNVPMLERVVAYASERVAAEGRSIGYSITTEATQLSPALIEFLAKNDIEVTLVIDGAQAAENDAIEPKIRDLVETHKTRPIAARVALTGQAQNVVDLFRYWHEEMELHEVGFALLTTPPQGLFAIEPSGLDQVLDQFRTLAYEYRDHALRDKWHGFSNVSDTLRELHQGVNQSHRCGAGLGMVGVAPSGEISPCHRFADSGAQRLGHVNTGIDRVAQRDFLKHGHVQSKYDCHNCWVRPVCAGGCQHEAYLRYGDTGHPNLHSCEWIRGWTDLCLRIYGEIAVKNPRFLNRFDKG